MAQDSDGDIGLQVRGVLVVQDGVEYGDADDAAEGTGADADCACCAEEGTERARATTTKDFCESSVCASEWEERRRGVAYLE